MLLSAKDGPVRSVSVITTDDANHFKLDEFPDIIVIRWDQTFTPDPPNARYFQLVPACYERLH